MKPFIIALLVCMMFFLQGVDKKIQFLTLTAPLLQRLSPLQE